jgi:hypothetical protein
MWRVIYHKIKANNLRLCLLFNDISKQQQAPNLSQHEELSNIWISNRRFKFNMAFCYAPNGV